MPRKRSANRGTIRERPDGRWEARIAEWVNGQRKRRSFFGKTRGEALDKMTEALENLRRGLPAAPSSQSLGEYLQTWLDDVAKPATRPKTYRTYSDIVKLHLIPGLGKRPLSKLGPQHIRAFMQEKLTAGLSPRTVKHLRNTLRAALNVAVEDGLIVRNPAVLAKPPKPTKQRVTAYTGEQARQFLAVVQSHRLEALFSVAIALGLRQGEILGLRWPCIDLDKGVLSVRYQLQRVDGKLQLTEPKTEESRRNIRLPQVAIAALRAHRERQQQERALAGSRWVETGHVFTTTIGTPLEARNMLRDFYGILLHRLDAKGKCTCGQDDCKTPGRHERFADLPRIRFLGRHAAARSGSLAADGPGTLRTHPDRNHARGLQSRPRINADRNR